MTLSMTPITERHVQAIWYDAALRPRRLFTRRGTEVNVVTPGEWNLGVGPDFRNAVLEVGRERRRIVGDVEIHLSPSDWDFHRHGADPRYRNVIAHVTWGCGPVPDTLPPGALSIWIGRFFNGDPSFSTDSIDLMAYPYARLPDGERPCERRIAHDPDRARALLAEAGRHRLRMKARRLAGRISESVSGACCRVDRDGADDASSREDSCRRQVYYEEVMTALGYSRNTTQFRHVAERIPIAELPTEREAAKNAFLAAGSFEVWNRVSFRPYNTPELRLEKAAEIFTDTEVMSLMNAADFAGADCRRMIRAMTPRHCLGRGRAAAIMANVVVPWAIAEGRIACAPDWLPPEDVSDPVRLTAFRLFGRDHNPAAYYATNGLLIQGLLQIHRDCCLQMHPDCSECRLGAEPTPSAAGDFTKDVVRS